MASVTPPSSDTSNENAHYLVLEAGRSYRSISPTEIIKYRDLLWFMSLRDIQVRYKQTALGVAWAVIQPLVTILVFTVFFGQLLGVSDKTGGVPYAIFVYSGLLPWTLFASTVNASSNSLVANAGILRKVYFPRLIIPLATSGAPLVDFAVSFIVLMGMMIYYGVAFSTALLFMPLFLLSLIITAQGVGIFLSAAIVRYRDFRHIIPFLIQIWFFLTPVIWPVSVVPERYQPFLLLNPMHGIIEAFRNMFLSSQINWADWIIALQTGAIMLIAGLIFFARTEKRMADII